MVFVVCSTERHFQTVVTLFDTVAVKDCRNFDSLCHFLERKKRREGKKEEKKDEQKQNRKDKTN
jgi:hypothetical protein